MESKAPNEVFKTRARLIQQLGEQLIRNESIALLELIKNSYDADASFCNITMENPDVPEKGKITIEDNGSGMDYKTLITSWLEIGTDNKEKLSNNPETKFTKKFHRRRLGEKGIGRFGVHKLGEKIKIITKLADELQEHVLEIDWTKVDESLYIEDIPVTIYTRKPKTFFEKSGNSSGTVLEITRLKQAWTKGLARNTARTIFSLNSPFETESSFKTSFSIITNDWLTGLMNFHDIEDYSLFKFRVVMERNKITDFAYEFRPWPTMKELKSRKVNITDKEISFTTRLVDNNKNEIYLSSNDIQVGKIVFTGLIFDRAADILRLGVNDVRGLKIYLNENGGVRVFRDNMRILDYGEKGNDWLSLDSRRVNEPTMRISNNIILASVLLDSEESAGLKEKANREGFIENNSYKALQSAIRFSLSQIQNLRNIDKERLRNAYSPKSAREPVIQPIRELEIDIQERVEDKNLQEDLLKSLFRIEKDYETMTDNLLKSAGAGLNLTIVIHQLDKMIENALSMLKSNVERAEITKVVDDMSKMVSGYSLLVKRTDVKLHPINGTITQSIFNMEWRLKTHKIKFELGRNLESGNEFMAYFSENYLVNSLMNLFDNSIWWLDYLQTENPKIFIEVFDNYLNGNLIVLFADNGPGFTLDPVDMVKPFITTKPDGMGIGLHLTNELMIAMDGELFFPKWEDFSLPEDYKHGAMVALKFRSK